MVNLFLNKSTIVQTIKIQKSLTTYNNNIVNLEKNSK